MTALLSCVLLAGAGILGWHQAFKWRKTAKRAMIAAERWQGVSESRTHQLGVWINRAFAAGYVPAEYDPRRVLRDIFAPSTERDVEQQREWRERRALTSRDHLTRHSVEATNDSEAATEWLMFTIGGGEVIE